MYVEPDDRRDPQYNEYVFNGVRIDNIEECSSIPLEPPEEHTLPVREIHKGSVLIISYIPEEYEDPVYRPYYVHRCEEESGLLICEDCRNPQTMFVEGGDGDQHIIEESEYDTVMSELVDKTELDYTVSTYPLSVLDLLENSKKISAHKSIVSDNWVIEQIGDDSDIVRYYI